MTTALDLIRESRDADLWKKCCGFIDLDVDQFMTIQRQLWLEQMGLLLKCDLGRRLLGFRRPRNIEEFRETIPLTTYDDYKPFLPEKIVEALPEAPLVWQRTSGRSNEYAHKWVPVTRRAYKDLGDIFMALLLFSSCSERGEVNIEEGDRFLYALAPPPYASGCWAHRLDDECIFKFLPPVDIAEKMEFQKRIEDGFQLGMEEGINMMAAIASILVAVGERFGQGGLKQMPKMLKKPRVLARLLGAVIKAKLAGRSLMPRDIWPIKGLISTGTDSHVYREKIHQLWGRYPLDVYGCTESCIISLQTWDYDTMTFVPSLNLLEFLPVEEHTRWAMDRSYQPRTLFMDEVIPERRYMVIVTNFLGGAFVRYLTGDVVTITALRNSKLNINIPQMTFYGRADDVIDFEAFTHAFFTEKMIWEGIVKAGIEYEEWVARKEVHEVPTLCIYLESKVDANYTEADITARIHEEFKKANLDYKDLETFFGLRPLKVTLLKQGAFQRYAMKKQASGSDLAHLKPPHMNPGDNVIEILMDTKLPT